MITRILLASGFIAILTGCLKTRADLRGEGDGSYSQKQLTVAQRERAKEIAAKPPPLSVKLDEHDDQLRNLNGRVDTLENFVNQMQTGKGGEQEAIAKEKVLLNQKLLAYEEALKKLEAQVQAQSEELARLKAPPASAATKASPRSSYDEAEDLFAAKRWKEAILSYQKYRDGNPKGKLYADSTYKIGVCFQELGMKDEARTFFEELREKFPSSKEAKKATTRLKTLK